VPQLHQKTTGFASPLWTILRVFLAFTIFCPGVQIVRIVVIDMDKPKTMMASIADGIDARMKTPVTYRRPIWKIEKSYPTKKNVSGSVSSSSGPARIRR
jgi:hypothetical protein